MLLKRTVCISAPTAVPKRAARATVAVLREKCMVWSNKVVVQRTEEE